MSAPRYLPGCAVVWRGPSLVDGRPIFVLVTGADRPTPAVWVMPDRFMAAESFERMRRDVNAGRYATREPFPLGKYVTLLGKREEVPSAVWATLDG